MTWILMILMTSFPWAAAEKNDRFGKTAVKQAGKPPVAKIL